MTLKDCYDLLEVNPLSARKQFHQLLVRDPKNSVLLFAIGLSYEYTDDKTNALPYYAKCINSGSNFWQVYYLWAAHLTHQNKAKGAMAFLRRAIDLKPDLPGPYLNVGILYLSDNQLSKARHYFQQALMIDPLRPELYFIIGENMFYQLPNSIEQVLAVAREFLAHNAEEFEALAAAFAEEEPNITIALYEHALKIQYSLETQLEIASLMLVANYPASVIEQHINQALLKAPLEITAYSHLTDLLIRERRTEEAMVRLEEARRKGVDFVEITNCMGMCYFRQGNTSRH